MQGAIHSIVTFHDRFTFVLFQNNENKFFITNNILNSVRILGELEILNILNRKIITKIRLLNCYNTTNIPSITGNLFTRKI